MSDQPQPISYPDPDKFVNFRLFKPSRTVSTEEKRHGELVRKLTVHLVDTYTKACGAFEYSLSAAPRRVLTKLSKGVHNSGYDNAEHDYICRVGDTIINPDGSKYEILERLGQGTFGQVLKCHNVQKKSVVAVKIIKNKSAYYHQALVEVRILQMLNNDFDAADEKRIVRMLDFFVYRKHLCIGFELLSVNLYDVLKQNSFRGVSIALIRVLTEQLLKAMRCLREANVIHCDLKPENVLLSNMQQTKIKLIDFGSACFENHTVYSYIQSRFYRSPEVLLGLPYTSAIDMWSLGCICAEMFLGLPIFPGHSEYDQICRIVEILGVPPPNMLDYGKHTKKYFRRVEEAQESGSGKSDREKPLTKPAAVGPGPAPAATATGTNAVRGAEDTDEGLTTNDRAAPDENTTQLAGEGQQQGSSQPPPQATTQQKKSSPGPSGCLPGEHSEDPEDNCNSASEGESTLGSNLSADCEEKARQARPDLDAAKKLTEEGLEATAASTDAENQDGTLRDLLKRTLDMGSHFKKQRDQRGHPPDFGSSDSRKGTASGDGHATSESCHSAASAISTAAGNSDIKPQEDSADGQVQPRACRAGGGGQVSSTGRRSRRRRGDCKSHSFRLKTREEYERDEHKKEPTPKKYFAFNSLAEMIELVPYKQSLSTRQLKEEEERRACFLQFLRGTLRINPDERWTPRQATSHPFITGASYDKNYRPPDLGDGVPSFMDLLPPGPHPMVVVRPRGDVPQLPAEAMGHNGVAASLLKGASSARTWQENTEADKDAGQPRSAPCSSRRHPNVAAGAGGAGPPAAAKGQGSSKSESPAAGVAGTGEAAGEKVPAAAGKGEGGKADGAGESGTKGASDATPGSKGYDSGYDSGCGYGHASTIYALLPLPDDNPAESYRPPIERIPIPMSNDLDNWRKRWSAGGLQGKLSAEGVGSPEKRVRGAYLSDSTGAPICSSSSAGSTPTGYHAGRHGVASPYSISVGSPQSASGGTVRGGNPASADKAADAHSRDKPSMPPYHSAPARGGGTHGTGGGVPVHTPQHQQRLGVPNWRSGGSRDGSSTGSRQGSPWHLPSPNSEFSTASDRLNSSQPSGSDSCEEKTMATNNDNECNFDECTFDEASQSDRPEWTRPSTQHSDSNCTTPRSNFEAPGGPPRAEEDLRTMISERVMPRQRLPGHSLDMTCSPTGTSIGNFREVVGMGDSGPVVPRTGMSLHGPGSGGASGVGGEALEATAGAGGTGSVGATGRESGHSSASSGGGGGVRTRPSVDGKTRSRRG